MEKDGRLVGHGAPADGRWSVCYLRQTAEWWTGHRMPKSYPFADACLTWPHVRISASSLARQRAVERARRHHTFRQQFTRMLCGRRACKLWSEHAPACRLVICMPNRISSLWARQALARRGPNSHGGVASLIGCALRSSNRTHAWGRPFLEGPGRLQAAGQRNGGRETRSFDDDGGGGAAAAAPSGRCSQNTTDVGGTLLDGDGHICFSSDPQAVI
jgi:hypothetical protein